MKVRTTKTFPKNEQEIAYITKVMFKEAVQAAYLAQETAAKDYVIEQKSLSCTLLLAFTLPLINGKWFTACYWVGDGAAAIFDTAIQKSNYWVKWTQDNIQVKPNFNLS